MSRTDAISRAEQQVRVRPLSDAAAAIVNSFAPHPNPHRAAARRQAAMVEEDKEDNDSDDVPSLYESSDRDSDADEYEEEARRFLHYQLSAVPERAAAVSASTFYASHRTRTQTQRRSVDPSVHPQFRTKTVCELFCTHCDMMLCRRGMSAILLGDTSVNLYSTDVKPDNLEYVGLAYTTSSCDCLIHDAACRLCGNTVAYNVKEPCAKCLRSTHNGHLWIFNSDGVRASERLDKSGSRLLRWSNLPAADHDLAKEDASEGFAPHHGQRTSGKPKAVARGGRRTLAELFVNR